MYTYISITALFIDGPEEINLSELQTKCKELIQTALHFVIIVMTNYTYHKYKQ